jgi:hypothetical protein
VRRNVVKVILCGGGDAEQTKDVNMLYSSLIEKSKPVLYIPIAMEDSKLVGILSEGDIWDKLGFNKSKSSESQNDSEESKPKGKSKPFERNPKRYEVNIG